MGITLNCLTCHIFVLVPSQDSLLVICDVKALLRRGSFWDWCQRFTVCWGSGSFWGWCYWLLRSVSLWGWWDLLFLGEWFILRLMILIVEGWFILRLVILTVCWGVVPFETGDMYCLLSSSFWDWWDLLFVGGVAHFEDVVIDCWAFYFEAGEIYCFLGEWFILRLMILIVEGWFILRLVILTVCWGSGSFCSWWYWLLRGGSFWGLWYWLLRNGSFWGWWYVVCWGVVHFETSDIDFAEEWFILRVVILTVEWFSYRLWYWLFVKEWFILRLVILIVGDWRVVNLRLVILTTTIFYYIKSKLSLSHRMEETYLSHDLLKTFNTYWYLRDMLLGRVHHWHYHMVCLD